jgi:hypothetical protein
MGHAVRFRDDPAGDRDRARAEEPRRSGLPRPDELAALAAFKAAHPTARIGRGEFSTWEAVIPEPDGERYAARASLGELLGRLGELYGEW